MRGKDAGHLRRILLWEVEAVGHIKTVTENQEVTAVNKVSLHYIYTSYHNFHQQISLCIIWYILMHFFGHIVMHFLIFMIDVSI